MAIKFMKARKWSQQKTNTTGSYLDYNDPRMEEYLGANTSASGWGRQPDFHCSYYLAEIDDAVQPGACTIHIGGKDLI